MSEIAMFAPNHFGTNFIESELFLSLGDEDYAPYRDQLLEDMTVPQLDKMIEAAFILDRRARRVRAGKLEDERAELRKEDA